MRTTNIVMAVAAIAAISVMPARAQSVDDRSGLYADIGINYTWPSITIDVGSGPSTTGKSSDLGYTAAIGVGLKNNKVRFGAQYDYFVKNDFAGVTSLKSTTQFMTAAITFYPSSAKNSLTSAVWIKVSTRCSWRKGILIRNSNKYSVADTFRTALENWSA